MASKDVDIQIADQVVKFVTSRRLKQPMILVNLGTMSGGGGCDGGSGRGGGGCGEGGSGAQTPYVNIVMVDGGQPGSGFVKVDTHAGIPVYLAKPVFDVAKKSGNPLFITLKGLVMKRLSLEGLDLTLIERKPQGESNCH